MAEKQSDIMTPLAIVGGGAALAIGAYLLFKKKGVQPGTDLPITCTFDYYGPNQNYIFRVVLGNMGVLGFDEAGGTKQEVTKRVEGAVSWSLRKVEFIYKVPSTLPKVSDLEVSIRYTNGSIVPGMRVVVNDIMGGS